MGDEPKPPQRSWPRIVLLTTKTSHGGAIVEALGARGIPLRGVVIEQVAPRQASRKLGRALRERGFRATVQAVARRLLGLLPVGSRSSWSSNAYYAARAGRVEIVGSLNDGQCRRLLEELEPDLLVLGGAPIIAPAILATARVATLNVHPGRLPRYRGVDVIAWAILEGEQPAVSVHQVDAGIDTGAVCFQSDLPILPGDTLAKLRRRAETLGAGMLAEVIVSYAESGQLPTVPHDDVRGRLYRRMQPADRRSAEAALRQLAAGRSQP